MPITWRIDTRQNFSGGNAVMRLGAFVSAYQMAFFPVKCKDIFLALMITTNIFLCWYEFSAEDKVFVSNWWILVIWQIPRGLIGVLIGWFLSSISWVIRGSLVLGRRWKVGSSLPSRQSEEEHDNTKVNEEEQDLAGSILTFFVRVLREWIVLENAWGWMFFFTEASPGHSYTV